MKIEGHTTVTDSPSKASYWLTRAACALDCAVQCGGGAEADQLERDCDKLAKRLKEAGN